MSKKIDPELKIELVEMYLNNQIGPVAAAKRAGLSGNKTSTFQLWVSIYKNEGPAGLLEQHRRKYYSKEIKLSAVHDYLDGKGSQQFIVEKYGLRSRHPLHNWIKVYTTHGEIMSYGSDGGRYMRKSRQTTLEERIGIVKDCLNNDRNYGAMAIKYECSYQQVRNWVLRYEQMGQAGLEDRRGRRTGTQPSRTPEEELRDKIAELERKNADLQMENDILKKVKELEMRNRCR